MTQTIGQQFEQEFSDLIAQRQAIELRISPLEAWCVMAQIQLALRHPNNTGIARMYAEIVARQLQSAIAITPALAQIAEMGWCPTFDVENPK